ncbi:hypothetical protein J6590_034024 [Homalodisca vitripennis]|nr:hypothetical protein J6590_034024 [Homalodisca vitripennis]
MGPVFGRFHSYRATFPPRRPLLPGRSLAPITGIWTVRPPREVAAVAAVNLEGNGYLMSPVICLDKCGPLPRPAISHHYETGVFEAFFISD